MDGASQEGEITPESQGEVLKEGNVGEGKRKKCSYMYEIRCGFEEVLFIVIWETVAEFHKRGTDLRLIMAR